MQSRFGEFFDVDAVNQNLDVVFKVGSLVQLEKEIVRRTVKARNNTATNNVLLFFIERSQRFLQSKQSGSFISICKQHVAMIAAFVAQVLHEKLAEAI